MQKKKEKKNWNQTACVHVFFSNINGELPQAASAKQINHLKCFLKSCFRSQTSTNLQQTSSLFLYVKQLRLCEEVF